MFVHCAALTSQSQTQLGTEQDVGAPPQGADNTGEPLLLKKLARHVAGHLRRLAFDSTRNLDGNGDHEADEASMQTSTGKKQDGPRSCPPSGLKLLSEPRPHDTFGSLNSNDEETYSVSRSMETFPRLIQTGTLNS
jgi:hypothetical protein